jgi:hypothetical protein
MIAQMAAHVSTLEVTMRISISMNTTVLIVVTPSRLINPYHKKMIAQMAAHVSTLEVTTLT